jgi:hypothetical protein
MSFNPEYSERLRSRVAEAGGRGIYVGVMLFEGWGLYHGNRRGGTEDGWAWRTHPFNPANNINGPNVEGADAFSGRVHTLRKSDSQPSLALSGPGYKRPTARCKRTVVVAPSRELCRDAGNQDEVVLFA